MIYQGRKFESLQRKVVGVRSEGGENLRVRFTGRAVPNKGCYLSYSAVWDELSLYLVNWVFSRVLGKNPF